MTCARIVLFLLASSLLPAQQTWIVDPSGAGNFTALEVAVAAAAPGDTLLVRAGSYNGTTIDKPLQVLGADSATVTVLSLAIGPFAPGLSGSVVVAGLRAYWLRVDAPTSLDGVRFDVGGINNHPATLRACTFGPTSGGFPGLTVYSGDVVLNGCAGFGTPSGVWVTLGCNVLAAQPALSVQGGTVTIANSTLNGVSAAPVYCPWYPLNGYPSSAILVTGGTLVVTKSTLRGGQQSGGGYLPPVQGSFFGDPSTVTLPASTTMTPIFLPATGGDSAQPGAAIGYRIETLSAVPAILAASLGTRSPMPTVLGTAWADPGNYVILIWGVSDGAGRLTGSIPLPMWVPHGLTVTIQGLALAPTASQFALGAPVVVQVL